MRLYFYGCLMLLRKFVLRQNTGQVICWFAEKMGVVYIKMAQILAMQNYGQIFTETDRQKLAQICDHCQPIKFKKIQKLIEQEYDCPLKEKFQTVDPEPLGSASMSQVHRAILKNGREVVIKVKRQDITRRIKHDVRQIQHIIHRFGRMAKFRNFLGSDRALDLWAEWIFLETDFTNEAKNIKRYTEFTESVNGKVWQTIKLKVPKVYSELCTENLIVMEFISYPTINQTELTGVNKQKIARCLNDYLSLSFYALLNGLPLVFHGDPHGGNLYLAENGDLGFLDLGLIFEFTAEESDFIRQLFLNAYAGKAETIVEMLVNCSEHTTFDRTKFTDEIRAEAKRFQQIPVTQFFVEMMNIFTRYNILPPIVFFKMAKAFLALFGINNFVENYTNTKELLTTQLVEYYTRRTLDDFQGLVKTGIQLAPNFLSTVLKQGIVKATATEVVELRKFQERLSMTLKNCSEVIDLIRS